jgi:predicted Rossmann fold nucleotide-binding protein DprA/Smf involved in DNA uptake
MKEFRVIIAGSRKYDDYETLRDKCNKILSLKLSDPACQVIIVSGGATGADALGERYAREHGLAIESHPADWTRYGRSAGPRRNAEMAAVADALIAFPKEGEKNIGTLNMIEQAKEKGLTIRISCICIPSCFVFYCFSDDGSAAASSSFSSSMRG